MKLLCKKSLRSFLTALFQNIFREALHDRGIVNELDAWLTFLCEDEPEIIEMLIQHYPYFRELYHDVYKLCENLEDIMGYFSKALQEMDRNTVQFMIEEQQEQLEKKQAEIDEKQAELNRKDARIAELERLLAAASK